MIRIEADLKNLSEFSTLKSARVEMRRFAQSGGESGPRSALRVSHGLHRAAIASLVSQAEDVVLARGVPMADALAEVTRLTRNKNHLAVWHATPTDAREADAALMGEA